MLTFEQVFPTVVYAKMSTQKVSCSAKLCLHLNSSLMSKLSSCPVEPRPRPVTRRVSIGLASSYAPLWARKKMEKMTERGNYTWGGSTGDVLV